MGKLREVEAMSEERDKAFEAWFESTEFSGLLDRRDGEYKTDATRLAHRAWRAARQSAGALKDHDVARVVNEIRDAAIKYRDTQQLRDRIADIVVPMLKSAGATDCPHGVDDGACKQCYAEKTKQDPVGIIDCDEINGWHMNAFVDWEKIGLGAKLYAAPIGATGQEPVAMHSGYGAVSWLPNGADLPEGALLYAAPTGDNGALGYAQRLATNLWEKHWKANAQNWKPLDDVLGVLTQIDNMVCGLAQPAESKRVELTEGQVIEAIQKACGEYRHGCSYSFEDVWNCIEAALLARAQTKGE